MSRAALLVLVGVAAACKAHAVIPDDPKPTLPLAAVARPGLCVTHGALPGASVTVPTFRAIATGTTGDAAALQFAYRGDSDKTRALASGEVRRQLGLKLRAANGCNLIYVMWRLDPHPEIEVSVKRNPGKRTHKECGAAGYTRIKSAKRLVVPGLETGASHTLQAEIQGAILAAWIDGSLAWVGELPDDARDMLGPAGMRSDNVKYDITQFSAIALVAGGSGAVAVAVDPKTQPKCVGSGSDGSDGSDGGDADDSDD